MCYSKELSIKSFLLGIISAGLLLYFGNKDKQNVNKAIATFFVFISLIQLMEYFMWKDIKCETGENYVASVIGPLINLLQPVIMLIIFSYFLTTRINDTLSFCIIGANILYCTYVLYLYKDYQNNQNNLCTKVNDQNHLTWNWLKNYNSIFYILLLLLNTIPFVQYNEVNVAIGTCIATLLFSHTNYKKNVGELWCFTSTGIPLVVLFAQKYNWIN